MIVLRISKGKTISNKATTTLVSLALSFCSLPAANISSAEQAMNTIAGETNSKSIEAIEDKAEKAASKGDFQKAIDLLEEVIELDPKRASAWLDLGICSNAVNEPAKGLECCNQAVALEPKNVLYRYHRGCLLLHSLNRYEDAVGDLEVVSRSASAPPDARYRLALAYLRTGNGSLAIKLANEILATEEMPEDIRQLARRVLASGHDQLGDYPQVETDAKLILEADPNDEFGFYYQGRAKLAADQFDEAIECFEKAAEIEEGEPAYHLSLAEAKLARSLAKEQPIETEVLSHCQRGMKCDFRQRSQLLNVRPDDLASMATSFLLEEDPRFTEELKNNIFEKFPETPHPISFIWFACIHKRQCDDASAVKCYEAALKLDPDCLPAKRGLVELLATSGNKALRDGPRALAIAKEIDENLSNGNLLDATYLGLAYAATGDFTQAESLQSGVVEALVAGKVHKSQREWDTPVYQGSVKSRQFELTLPRHQELLQCFRDKRKVVRPTQPDVATKQRYVE